MKGPRRRTARRQRRGAVLVFTVFLLIVFIAVLALVVDIGYLANARTELQRSADAAAMASCWDYISELADGEEPDDAIASAKTMAMNCAAANDVCQASSTVAADDVVFGYLADAYDPAGSPVSSDPSLANAVTVRVRRNPTLNGQVPFFFASVFGLAGIDAEATSTAYVVRDIRGFRTPGNGTNLDIVPIAIDEQTWDNLLEGSGQDDWTYTEDGNVQWGDDGVVEMNMYPQGTGSPGNRGTVDIGSNNNSTNDISRQITDGVSPADMEYHGGELVFNEDGLLFLNGDTGISAGIKDELLSIKGKPRIVPIYREVNGPGNNAIYSIVKWAGIRIMYVKLTGSESRKRVVIQPASIVSSGVVPTDPTSETSNFIYSPVTLTR